MATVIRVRSTEERDLPALDELFQEGFGHGLDGPTWEWKYRRLPGEARSRVAEDGDGRLLAHAGALALAARAAAGEGPIWQLVDFVGTGRGEGLRPAMVECGKALLADLPRPGDLPWIYGFPSARHFRLGRRVFGYRALAEIVPQAAPLPAAEPSSSVDLETSDRCGDWAEEVWDACGAWSVRRSAAFLNWRYHARPGRYYRFYRLRRGATAGLAVFAFVGEEAWAAEVWLPGPAGGWAEALRAVAADLRRAGIARWRFWPLPGGGDDLLSGLGLAALPERVFVGCRAAAWTSGDPAAAARGFHTPMGDYDLV